MHKKRIDLIDIVRGVALVGILFASIALIERMPLDINNSLDMQIYRFAHLVF